MSGLYARIVGLPGIAPLKPTWFRARMTDRPLRFFLRETLHRRRGGLYRLRDAPHVPIAVRHTTPDPLVIDEIFLQRVMAEPPEVAERLDALGRPPRVLDVGANVGLGAAWFAYRWPGSSVTCVEPDPANAAVLRRAASRSDGAWTVLEAAAATTDGVLRFAGGGFATSHLAEDGDLEVQAVDLFRIAAEQQPDVLKLDAEGGEWAILADPRLADFPATAITLEYHPEHAPSPDTRAAVEDLLRSAGYAVHHLPGTTDAPAGVGMAWAWR